MGAAAHPIDPELDNARVQRERDLYRRLLSLGACSALDPLLEEALALVVEVTDADQAVIEVYGSEKDPEHASRWFAHGCTEHEVRDIRAAMSRGIIARALATGTTVETPSALTDPRFRDRASVHRGRIEAVLCAPIGGDASLGVLYIQGAGPFRREDRALVELVAEHLAPFVDRMLVRQIHAIDPDHCREVRARLRCEDVVGRSEALARALEQAALAAPLDVNVLLLGESGTGKSQLARVIHDNSARASGMFVELNCAALPETLLESELFGAVAGAHSTADRPILGKVAAAAGGTLFLDEIGELPLSSQAKLLQLLQSHTYYPLGAARPERADVRVIAASNRDLQDAVRARRFREDLFFRLQVLPIRLPTLAERSADVPALAEHACREATRRHALPQLSLSPGALQALRAAEWPGNVRQLAHSVEAAVIRAAGERAQHIERRHLFPESSASPCGGPEPATLQEATRRFQRILVDRTLEACDWNVTAAARQLDVARSHLYNLIKAFGLERHAS